MFIPNKISNAKPELKTFLISNENSSKTISSRAAHIYTGLVHIRNYPLPLHRDLHLGVVVSGVCKIILFT